MAVKLVTLVVKTPNPESLHDFYALLGGDLRVQKVKVGTQYSVARFQSFEIAFYPQSKNETVAPTVGLRFEVDDVVDIVAKMSELAGVQVLMDVEDLPDGKKAILLDPDGHSVEITQPWPLV